MALTDNLPNIGITGASVLHVGKIILIGFLVLLIIGAITTAIVFWIVNKRKWNKTIVIFEKVAQSYQPTRKDLATEIRLGTGGDTVFYLKKNKKYLPRGDIQAGAGQYWYVIREDGEWINIGIQDIDWKFREVGVNFLDKEARHSRVALQRGVKERYDTESWWKQNLPMIIGIVFFIVLGIIAYLTYGKFSEQASVNLANTNAQLAVTSKLEQLLSAMDNLCSGSGVRVVG